MTPPGRGDYAALAAAFARPMSEALLANMSTCPQRAFRSLCLASTSTAARGWQRRSSSDDTTTRRLAVIVSGHPRTMLDLDAKESYSELMALVRRHGWHPHVFAHLDIAHTRVNASRIEAALREWGVPFTLQRDAGRSSWGSPTQRVLCERPASFGARHARTHTRCCLRCGPVPLLLHLCPPSRPACLGPVSIPQKLTIPSVEVH